LETPYIINHKTKEVDQTKTQEYRVEMRLYKHAEIIAKYLKQVGLIQLNSIALDKGDKTTIKNNLDYEPKCFSQNQSLELLNGATFGDE
jgi:hypothetical protein